MFGPVSWRGLGADKRRKVGRSMYLCVLGLRGRALKVHWLYCLRGLAFQRYIEHHYINALDQGVLTLGLSQLLC